MLKLISHAESAPPNRKIFQNGTAKTLTAVKFQRGGPKFSSPLADSGWDQAFVSNVNTCTCAEHFRQIGPNGLKVDKETTHFIVRWIRVVLK